MKRNVPDAIKHLKAAAEEAHDGIEAGLKAVNSVSNDPQVISAVKQIVEAFEDFEKAAIELRKAAEDLV